MYYIILEVWPSANVSVISDGEGHDLTFDTFEDAKIYADKEIQFPKIVEIT